MAHAAQSSLQTYHIRRTQLLFSSRYNPDHVLHRLLIQPKNTDYNLRQRTHNLLCLWTSMLL